MSGPFRSIDTAASGLGAHQEWLDSIAHNIANVDTRTAPGEEPFRAVHPVFAETADGVRVAGEQRESGEAALVFDPSSPLADAKGTVQLAHVDVGAELTDMIVAQRGYQANLRTVQAARERYEEAMRIGR